MSDEIRLLVQDALEILWSAHLSFTPSGQSMMSNRKALCRSFGGRYLDEISSSDFRKHRESRLKGLYPHKRVGLGTVFHDHGILHLLYSKMTEWKRDKMTVAGYDFSTLKLPPFFPTDGIKKIRPPKRKIIARPEEFLTLCQNATDRLKRTMEALIDLDIREGDLAHLRPRNYNPYTDQVEWVQSKTGKENCVPATDRIRSHFVEAKDKGREFVYDLTNSRKEFEEARIASKLTHLTKRDLRKTTYNATLRHTGSHHLAGMMAGHSSTRTGIDHYELEFREDLKSVVKYLESVYRSS